jgi:short-subunit dehydrogenase
VADFLNAKDLIKKVIQEQGKLDVLINNAGLAGHGEVGELAPAAVNQIIDTNVKGVIYQTRAALPELIKSSGSVLFVSSIAGLWGFPAYSLYSLSKMALTAFAETLRIENTYRGLFVGISYVCFTENEPDKQWLNPAGGLESLPGRNKLFLATREKTARIMLRQIARKKYRVVHSLLGKLTYFMTRFFPGIVDWVFREYYRSRKKGDPV